MFVKTKKNGSIALGKGSRPLKTTARYAIVKMETSHSPRRDIELYALPLTRQRTLSLKPKPPQTETSFRHDHKLLDANHTRYHLLHGDRQIAH